MFSVQQFRLVLWHAAAAIDPHFSEPKLRVLSYIPSKVELQKLAMAIRRSRVRLSDAKVLLVNAWLGMYREYEIMACSHDQQGRRWKDFHNSAIPRLPRRSSSEIDIYVDGRCYGPFDLPGSLFRQQNVWFWGRLRHWELHV